MLEDSPTKIYCANFNQNNSCLALGTSKGFTIFSLFPFKKYLDRELSFGVGNIEMLDQCNLLVLSPCETASQISDNKIIIWDDAKNEAIKDFQIPSKIINIKLKRSFLFVVSKYNITVFSMSNFELLDKLDTINNTNGIMASAMDTKINIIAYPDNSIGKVIIKDYDNNKLKDISIRAHDNFINTLTMNKEGSLLATASVKGTLIRIFNTTTGNLTQELRRGTENAEIYSLAFDYNSTHLCCSSNRGTVHIFNIKNLELMQSTKENTKSIFSSFLSTLGINNNYINSEWSFAQYKLNYKGKNICTFINNCVDKVVVFTETGYFYVAQFNSEEGGACQEIFSANLFALVNDK